MMKWIIIAILLLPVAEIATFVAVAVFIGFGWALALLAATSLAGLMVLRRAGRGQIANLRVAVSDRATGIEGETGGIFTVLAGILLFLPGFLTGLAGALLLLGPVQRWCRGALDRAAAGMTQRANTQRGVVDLEPEEWRQVAEPKLKDDRSDPDRR